MTMERISLKPGVAPSAQLKEANRGRKGRARFVYLPHVGAKERARAAKRAAKAAAKEAARGSTEYPTGLPTDVIGPYP